MQNSRNIYVAVIDDHPSVCRSMGRWLRSAHIQPVTYSSAEDFLMDTKRPRFDCLLLDIQLKGMSGLDLARRLSSVRDATPVIFITAHDDPEIRAQAEEIGCVGYFRKNEPGTDILSLVLRLVRPEAPESEHLPENPTNPEQTQEIKMKIHRKMIIPLAAVSMFLSLAAAQGQEADKSADLAKKLANPVAALISVPLQYNYDEYGELNDGASVSRLNIQPVIPFSVTEDWNMITRTIVPLIDQQDFPFDARNESGLGDIVASQFFSPKEPTSSGWIWGVGPVELLPSASSEMLGGEKWGLGPTALALKQTGPWTWGMLANHIWSVAGDDDRADLSLTFVQPFLSYITKTKTTLGLNMESTYDWENEQWTVPVNVSVSQLLKLGPQIIQLSVGARYWADSPDNGAENWGARIGLTFLFPK